MASLCGNKPLREVIREILLEELRQFGLIAATKPVPALSFVADVVRHYVRQAFSSSDHGDEPRYLTYADAVRHRVIAPSAPMTPMTGPPPTLQTQSLSPPATFPTSLISLTRRMPYGQHATPQPDSADGPR